MRELDGQYGDTGVEVRFVVIGTPQEAGKFCARFGEASRCVADRRKRSYAAMGFERFNLLHLLSDRDLGRRALENHAAGFRQDWRATKIGNAAQLPGAALFDAVGIMRWIHRGKHPGDLPAMSEMLDICRRELRGRPA